MQLKLLAVSIAQTQQECIPRGPVLVTRSSCIEVMGVLRYVAWW